MKIIEPKAELWIQENPVEHVAKCASVCYQSSEKTGEKAQKFYNALISSNHVSMLRHESCYYIYHKEMDNSLDYDDETKKLGFTLVMLQLCPYVQFIDKNENYYIATNANFVLANSDMMLHFAPYKVTPEEFKKECPELMRYTICCTTQISTSRELNRVSPNNIAEMSTRYIKFGGKIEPSIVRPWWLEDKDINSWRSNQVEASKIAITYLGECDNAFLMYQRMLDLGMKPEDARGLLPLDTMTKVIYTYSIKEWSNILKLRLYGTTGKPHGNAKVIAGLIEKELNNQGYYVNDNLDLVYTPNVEKYE